LDSWLAEKGILCEQVILWYCEEFARAWESFAISKLPQMTLRVDKDFTSIYNRDKLLGGFGSCMVNKPIQDFYANYVKARAASLLDSEGLIVARCIIFDECVDARTGEVLRLAERQYSTNGSDLYKQVLVNKLIAAGEIDGYKRVGADCHSPQSFVKNDGTTLYDNEYFIRINGDLYDCFVPYMDSFKYYYESDERAYNVSDGCCDYELTETDGSPGHQGENYDSWNEQWTDDDIVTVYYNGSDYTCSEYCLDDFRWVDSEQEYHHYEDVGYCDECGEYFLFDNKCYSELLDADFCCEDCLDRAEEEYKSRNWHYSEVTGEYYESIDELIEEEGLYKDRYWHYSELTGEYYEYKSELEAAEEEYKKNHKNEEEEK
jgi:hypothetical protein